MSTPIPRRDFLVRAAAFSAAFGGLALAARAGRLACAGDLEPEVGYGPLVRDPSKVLDLPAGFSYVVVSRAGEAMADGLRVPGLPDGMAAFEGEGGLTILVRNHEIGRGWNEHGAFGEGHALLGKMAADKVYDAGKNGKPSLGGTTTLVYDTRSKRLVRQFMSLAGTELNCAGGPTPWGSWLSCEEAALEAADADEARPHGYVFEVPATLEPALAKPEPIRAMGRFRHEAVGVDARTGVVYLTEDRADGLLYRYLPVDRRHLIRGGRLQALMIEGHPGCETDNRGRGPRFKVGERHRVRWIDLTDIEPSDDSLRRRGKAAGAAEFARGEGMWAARDGIYAAMTLGGASSNGQLWRYVPGEREGDTEGESSAPGTIELFVEPNDASLMENPDNITASPWGDLIACEDNAVPETEPGNRLLGITPEGKVYALAKNAADRGEFAGAAFSPDGTTLFVNLQTRGMTLAISGPWRPRA